MNLTLSWAGKSGDGKRAFVEAEQNDGWRDLRIEVDTDDCDGEYARAAMQEVITRVNAANGSGRQLCRRCPMDAEVGKVLQDVATGDMAAGWLKVAAETEAAGLTALAGDLRRAAQELAGPQPLPCPFCGGPAPAAAWTRRAPCASCAQLRAELDAALGVTEDRDAWRLICQQAAAALRRWHDGPLSPTDRLPRIVDIMAALEARPEAAEARCAQLRDKVTSAEATLAEVHRYRNQWEARATAAEARCAEAARMLRDYHCDGGNSPWDRLLAPIIAILEVHDHADR